MNYFTREDWRLFMNIETLPQKAGVNRENIGKLVVKELVDNALDVCGECDLYEKNGYIRVIDYGNGLDQDDIEVLFSINRPLVSSKLLRLPTRGALGNGLRVVSGAVISTGGELIVESKGKIIKVTWDDNGRAVTNLLDNYETGTKKYSTAICVKLGSGFIDDSILEWGFTAINLADIQNKGKEFKGKTSPYWYTSEAFYDLCRSFSGDVGHLLLMFNGVKKDNLEMMDGDFLYLKTNDLELEQTDLLLEMLKKIGKEVSSIGYVGKDTFQYEDSMYFKEYGKITTDVLFKSLKGKHDAKIPFTIETWISLNDNGYEFDRSSLDISVNKTQITGDVSISDKNKKEVWINLGSKYWTPIKAKGPFIVKVNIQTPYMPIKSDGKAPDFSFILDDLQKLIEKVAKKVRRNYDNALKKDKMSEKEVILLNLDTAIQKTSGDGEYLFSQRQLYYAVRPYVINSLGKELDYNYFCRILTEYEAEYGDINGLYRDPRGVLYHPHTGEEIPLGTLAVKEYERPRWTFNKIIYSEKEGFFTILKKAKFPERFDCALLTSKGFASRAVKDLFDLLGETDEEIQFFCIHDADAAGTKIYETLQEATLARPERKVKIINLGLDPWEALEMGLEVEKVENSNRRRAVANYVYNEDSEWLYEEYGYNEYESWSDWLQKNRVELNAMTTPQFLNWLENKMESFGIGKVVPDNYTLNNTLNDNIESLVRNKLMKKLLLESEFEEKVKNEMKVIEKQLKSDDLIKEVEDGLKEFEDAHWSDIVSKIAKDII